MCKGQPPPLPHPPPTVNWCSRLKTLLLGNETAHCCSSLSRIQRSLEANDSIPSIIFDDNPSLYSYYSFIRSLCCTCWNCLCSRFICTLRDNSREHRALYNIYVITLLVRRPNYLMFHLCNLYIYIYIYYLLAANTLRSSS